MANFTDTVVLKSAGFDEVIDFYLPVLKGKGFGLLTEVDVQKKFHDSKVDLEFKKYRMFGVCMPRLANAVLKLDPCMGIFLPCKLLIYENAASEVVVSMMSPVKLFAGVGIKQGPMYDVMSEAAVILGEAWAVLTAKFGAQS